MVATARNILTSMHAYQYSYVARYRYVYSHSNRLVLVDLCNCLVEMQQHIDILSYRDTLGSDTVSIHI